MYCMQFCVLDLLRVNKIEEKFIRRFEIHRLRHCSRTMVNIRTVFSEQNNTEKKHDLRNTYKKIASLFMDENR